MNAPARPSWEEMHYRLVSLWDIIMQEFDARRFLEVWTPVISVHVARNNLVAYGAAGHTEDPNIRTGEGDHFYQKVKALWELLVQHDFELSSDRAKLILEQMVAGVHMSELNRNLGNLHGRICDEMKRRTVLILPSIKRELYEQTEPLFGKTVNEQFPTNAAWEIGEAGKCLALRRDTACVFHLMRTMEVALEALKLCLRLPEPIKPQDKAWGTVLGNYKKEIDARKNMQHERQWKSAGDREFFNELHASLIAVKDAWRNKTMHVEKPYTTEQAEHIFAVVKGFMQKVASRLDEDGLPRA